MFKGEAYLKRSVLNRVAQKMKLSVKGFFSKCDHADLVTFTEEILNRKLRFLCRVSYMKEKCIRIVTDY